MNVVITGASRGIGLELTRQAVEQGDRVLAVARSPKNSESLQALQRDFPKLLEIVDADVTDPEKISRALGGWKSVDILINNAGIMREGTTAKDFLESFTVNTIAPFMVTQELLPWLKKGERPTVVNVTSRMGSVADNASGGYYAYRSSKTALNMITKSLSRDLKWLTAIVIHPGWVQTDMGGTGAPVSPTDSAMGIWSVARKVKPESSGEFFDYQGQLLPW